MSIEYIEEVTITRRRTKRVSGKHSGHKAIGSRRKPQHSGWHKEIYGKCMSKNDYYDILETFNRKYMSFPIGGDEFAVTATATELRISPAIVAAVVSDSRKAIEQ